MLKTTDRRFRPGDVAPASGRYREYGSRSSEGQEVAVERGEPLPPTTRSGATYRFVDPDHSWSDDDESGD